MSDGLIAGFERRRLPGPKIEIDARVAGRGPPSLLLHGYPQTRLMWRDLRPALAALLTMVVRDLRTLVAAISPLGGRTVSAPTLLWGQQYGLAQSRPIETWCHCAEDLRGHAVSAGHFIAEETPTALVSAFREFFSRARTTR